MNDGSIRRLIIILTIFLIVGGMAVMFIGAAIGNPFQSALGAVHVVLGVLRWGRWRKP